MYCSKSAKMSSDTENREIISLHSNPRASALTTQYCFETLKRIRNSKDSFFTLKILIFRIGISKSNKWTKTPFWSSSDGWQRKRWADNINKIKSVQFHIIWNQKNNCVGNVHCVTGANRVGLPVFWCTQQEMSLEVVGRRVDISTYVGWAGGVVGYNFLQVVQVAMNQWWRTLAGE